MGMYIESLHVSNVGPFNELDVKFNPNMNVVVGVNGVGKTSLLRCISYCMTSIGLENIRMRKNAMLKLFCVQNEEKFQYGADNIVDEDQEYRVSKDPHLGLTMVSGYHSGLMYEEKDYNILAIGAYRYFAYKSIQGMLREAAHSERRKQYLRRNPSFLDSIEMPDIKQWMVNRYFQIDKEWAKIEKKNWKKIMSSLSLIAPHGSDFKFLRIERDLEPIFSLNGDECYLEELSSGFKSILSIVFTIVDWIEGINEDQNALINEAVGTVLIDEIDAHLHPSWQATILDSLRNVFPKLQFIVTTHSPSVLMSAKKGEVILFDNNNGFVELEPIAESYSGWEFNDVLTNVMQTPPVDRIGIFDKLAKIDKAFENKNIDLFKAGLEELKQVLSPSDSILKLYNIKLAQLQLK